MPTDADWAEAKALLLGALKVMQPLSQLKRGREYTNPWCERAKKLLGITEPAPKPSNVFPFRGKPVPFLLIDRDYDAEPPRGSF